jgi:hypothetical protein
MIFFLLIKDWVMGRLLKVGLVAAGATLVISGCMIRDNRIEQRGVAKVVEASKEKAKDANVKSEKARAAARTPGAADRLRKDPAVCGDC